MNAAMVAYKTGTVKQKNPLLQSILGFVYFEDLKDLAQRPGAWSS